MEEHALLTHTGPGTPCGELMRRYWQPAEATLEVCLAILRSAEERREIPMSHQVAVPN